MKYDHATNTIAQFAASVTNEDLTPGIVKAVVQRHLDAIGCALGGFHTEPSRIARSFAETVPVSSGCSVYGLENKIAPEQAVFANVTMVRQLDCNDTFCTKSGGHPSDVMPPIFAAAELAGASADDVIRGIYVAYEIFGGLSDAYSLKTTGWDQGAFVSVAVAMGTGIVLGLQIDELLNAVGIAISPSMPLRATRTGDISNWKGSATAHGAMSGLFAARIAQKGLSGPRTAFEGDDGFNQHVPPLHELRLGEKVDGFSEVERTSFKAYPSVYHAQALIPPILGARDSFDVNDIVGIAIETYERAWYINGGGLGDKEQKWDPKTRETADHSLPYVTAVALLDGDVTLESFSEERMADPAIHELTKVTTVAPRDDLSAVYPEQVRTDTRITLRDGREVLLEASYPLGHAKNPMSDELLSRKFKQFATVVLDEKSTATLEQLLWNFESLKDLSELSSLYRNI